MFLQEITIDEDIYLKQFELKNADDLYELTKKNQKELIKWFSWADEIKLDLTKKFIKESLKSNEGWERGDFGIYYKNELVGAFGIIDIDREKKDLELGYWLAEEARGKGIMTRVCNVIINYCFEVMKFTKIYIAAFAENVKSRNLPEKLGFEIEDADRRATIMNKRRSFYLWYSKTRDEHTSHFWEKLDQNFNNSKIVIEHKRGDRTNNFSDNKYPADFGYLQNDWDEDEQFDIWYGSSRKEENIIDTIICAIDSNNKFADIVILYKCSENEKNVIYNYYNNNNSGSLLIRR